MTDELLKAEVAALVRELSGYESRAAVTEGDEQANWEGKAELVREQLRLRGERSSAPQKRASSRQRQGGEQRGGSRGK